MVFDLTILGSASAIPTKERFPSAQLLNMHGRLFLIDCGEGAQIQLIRAGIGLQKIHSIFISHLHGDHFFGLPGLMSSMHLVGRKEPLIIYAPPELESLIIPAVTHSHNNPGFDILFRALDMENEETLLNEGSFRVSTVQLKHGLPAKGFLFAEKPAERNIKKDFVKEYQPDIEKIKAVKAGADYLDAEGRLHKNSDITLDPPAPRAYAYCSDTAYLKSLADDIQAATTLYHEASYMEQDATLAEERLHSTAAQAATVAKDASCKKLILGHFSARYKNLDLLLEEAKAIFPNTILAEDLLKVHIE